MLLNIKMLEIYKTSMSIRFLLILFILIFLSCEQKSSQPVNRISEETKDFPDSLIFFSSMDSALLNPGKVFNLECYSTKSEIFFKKISLFKNLRSLKFSNNSNLDIKWAINEISTLKHLTKLEFRKCKIEYLPSTISKLTNLEELTLTFCELKALPDEINKLNKLQILILPYNKIKMLPDAMASLTSLKSLDLAVNKISRFPNVILNLSQLEYLDISLNEIDTIPLGISNLKNLKVLRLADIPVVRRGSNFYQKYKVRSKEIQTYENLLPNCTFLYSFN